MKVKELIAELQNLPPDAQVSMLWDGASRSTVDGAYLAQSGDVIVGPSWESAYNDEDRPNGAPTEKQDAYFRPLEKTER